MYLYPNKRHDFITINIIRYSTNILKSNASLSHGITIKNWNTYVIIYIIYLPLQFIQNHSLPNAGTEYTPQCMNIPNFD